MRLSEVPIDDESEVQKGHFFFLGITRSPLKTRVRYKVVSSFLGPKSKSLAFRAFSPDCPTSGQVVSSFLV